QGRADDSGDAELVAFARSELERVMGSLGKMRFARVYRYRKASPQPIVGHLDRIERIRARAAAMPGLHVVGAAYEGVGIPDCVRQARTVARTVIQELSRAFETRAASG